MVTHTGLEKTNPWCLLKIHQDCGLEMELSSLQVGRRRGASCVFWHKIWWWPSIPMVHSHMREWEQRVSPTSQEQGFCPKWAFQLRAGAVAAGPPALGSRAPLPLHGRLQCHLQLKVTAGCWWQWGRWLPLAAASPPGGYIKAVEHVCSRHRQWGMRWVHD